MFRYIKEVFKTVQAGLPHRYFATAEGLYDVAIVGGGPAGYECAIKASQLGLKTVCIEKRGALGGCCLNVGCIPTKTMLYISHQYEQAHKKFNQIGINVKDISYDWAKIQKKRAQVVKTLASGVESLFKKYKVEYVKGIASLESKTSLGVKLLDNKGYKKINAKNIILATGSDPKPLPGLPFDEKIVWTSTGALESNIVPKTLLVLGGGVIGVELGSVYNRMGTQVTIIQSSERICKEIDSEIGKALQTELQKQGIKIITNQKVTQAKKMENGVMLEIESKKDGKKQTLKGDAILVSIGRYPYIEGLGARELGIALDKNGAIDIDDNFQTNIENIYAIGDVVRGPMLAHKASEEGIAVAEYIHNKGGHVNYHAIPSVIYTHPEVAQVGKTEDELKKEKIEYKKGVFPFIANGRSLCNSETTGMVKVVANKKTDKILGVTIMHADAGELIAEAGLAIESGCTCEDVARTCHAHPTFSEAFMEACMAAYFKSINF